MDWQSIQSAPRDRCILAWAAGWHTPLVCWWDVHGLVWIGGGYIRDGKNCAATHAPPTFWREVPEPPNVSR